MAANIDATANTQDLGLFSVLRRTTADFKKYLHLTELLEEEVDGQDDKVSELSENERHRSGDQPIAFKDMEQGDSPESQKTLQRRIPIQPMRSRAYSTVGRSEDTESSVTDLNSVSSYGSVTGTTSISSIYLPQREAVSSKLRDEVNRCRVEESSTISDTTYSHCSSESTNNSDNLAYQSPRNMKTQRMQKRYAREASATISDASNGKEPDKKANTACLEQVKEGGLFTWQVAPHVDAGTMYPETVEEKVEPSEAPAKDLPFSNFFFGNANVEDNAVKQSDGSDSKKLQNPRLHVDVSAQCVSPLLPYNTGGAEGKCQYAHRPRIHTQEAETQLDEGSLTDLRQNDVSDNLSSERLEHIIEDEDIIRSQKCYKRAAKILMSLNIILLIGVLASSIYAVLQYNDLKNMLEDTQKQISMCDNGV